MTLRPSSSPLRDSVAGTAGPAVLIMAMAAATLVTVWAMQHAGYVPCELCLLERNPYYAGMPLALVTGFLAHRGVVALSRWGYGLLGVLFAVSAGLATYHAGVEWKLWAGPTGCTGAIASPTTVTDFMAQLKAVKVVRCDAPALVVAGLSLAGWNVLVSLLLAGLAGWGARLTGRRHAGVTTSPSRSGPPSATLA